MLKASLSENYLVDLSDEHLRSLVDATFSEADENNDGKISYDEYTDMVKNHPSIIDNISISQSILELPLEIQTNKRLSLGRRRFGSVGSREDSERNSSSSSSSSSNNNSGGESSSRARSKSTKR
eukprot:TRINITY_DN386_c2_g1_i1.p1 TRINITY_DN386_c2_g1~~TRINITY_DN386_c2_g1_i1.p1  ORF type:complete len:124 (+),score=25.22 TRINITY_DN386_c2_g1_i1:501-872(+)